MRYSSTIIFYFNKKIHAFLALKARLNEEVTHGMLQAPSVLIIIIDVQGNTIGDLLQFAMNFLPHFIKIPGSYNGKSRE